MEKRLSALLKLKAIINVNMEGGGRMGGGDLIREAPIELWKTAALKSEIEVDLKKIANPSTSQDMSTETAADLYIGAMPKLEAEILRLAALVHH